MRKRLSGALDYGAPRAGPRTGRGKLERGSRRARITNDVPSAWPVFVPPEGACGRGPGAVVAQVGSGLGDAVAQPGSRPRRCGTRRAISATGRPTTAQ